MLEDPASRGSVEPLPMVSTPATGHPTGAPQPPTNTADDVAEVTETKVVGVTETGVIRKRSFKRKVTKEEKAQKIGYGQDKDEYKKIVERVMKEKLVSGTLEGLNERMKMISYMYTDCMDMVGEWERKRQARLQALRRNDPLLYLSVGCASAFAIFICWILIKSLL